MTVTRSEATRERAQLRARFAAAARVVRVSGRRSSSLLAHGEPMVWLTGGALAIGLVMIAGAARLVLVRRARHLLAGAAGPRLKMADGDGRRWAR